MVCLCVCVCVCEVVVVVVVVIVCVCVLILYNVKTVEQQCDWKKYGVCDFFYSKEVKLVVISFCYNKYILYISL